MTSSLGVVLTARVAVGYDSFRLQTEQRLGRGDFPAGFKLAARARRAGEFAVDRVRVRPRPESGRRGSQAGGQSRKGSSLGKKVVSI